MSFEINNRRYTGCKYKLTDWIKEVIKEGCPNCTSFCDIFAGTGVVTASVIDMFEEYIINDFLFSNEVIYNAFFLKEAYSEEKMYAFYSKYHFLTADSLPENYFSKNFGGNFFSKDDALIIGFIRDDIERNRKSLNLKEYSILVASLLYSADRSANTCGHYEAFIKNKEARSSFRFELIMPIIKSNIDPRDIKIYREDSNLLVKRIQCDITYIDPPYSSRQYSRFYHVLETLTKWDSPVLSGTALKPPEENMSEYCKSKALDAFKDLIYSSKSRFLIVSYNNTYDSKSSSSQNKMTLEDIKAVLDNKGKTKVYAKDHKAFNAGKTDMQQHQELLFVTEVGVSI